MSITVRIGEQTRPLEEADESWVTQQINRRRRDGADICAQVSIKTGGLSIKLTTPACGGGRGGRPPTNNEREVIELWRKLGLTSEEFTGGNLVAFLKQLHGLF